MSLYEKRYYTVAQLLRQEHVDSVLDFGCGDGKFLCYLAQDPFFARIGGVDISTSRLTRARHRIGDDSRICLFLQSFLDPNPKFFSYAAIVVMEVIEHLEEDELHLLFQNIFQIAPSIIIATTPNREYNWHYPTLYNGLRHSSHRFEFTQIEMKHFAEKIMSGVHNYSFNTGFCDYEGASQFIMWKKVLEP
jgi:2-polyprenyl-3-methyl-5-hydroxy-6-metoxy-1,4-benzoquinol methylase